MSETRSVSNSYRLQMEHGEPTESQFTESTTEDKKRKTKPKMRRYRSLLVCIVCKGDAHCTYKKSFHRIIRLHSFFRSRRLQFRRDILRIMQSILSSKCLENTGNYLKCLDANISSVLMCMVQGKLKCRGSGDCDVTSNITKRCRKCRLEKCFQSGKQTITSNSMMKFAFHSV